MHRRLGTALTVLALGAAALSTVTPAQAADDFTVQTLHFKVSTGPDQATACDIVGDVYTPTVASPTNQVPAILATNGFGGSKDDQAALGRWAAGRGYVVLSYSGLGFGGSGCKITLDDPDWDGRAGSQLVSYLGGADGIAYLDAAHTQPAPILAVVRRDATAHDGTARPNDPRVGMIGGSYGGQIQFAVAGVDPRLDTIIPIITWNDLSYSLGPNNTGQQYGVTAAVPGAVKLNWGAGFSALGVADGLQNFQNDPSRMVGCPNFADWVCPALLTAATLGYLQPDAVTKMRHASVSSYIRNIRIPVFLWQGEKDTLFNINEAIATYQALKAQHTPVKMMWQSWGHSASSPLPGEFDMSNPDPVAQYQTGRALAWFDHYLKDQATDLGPNFAYFRPWVSFSGNAKPAYATASSFPVGTATSYYLSGNALTTSPLGLARGSQTFTTPVAGLPTGFGAIDVIGSLAGTPPLPESDLPGTFASYQTPALAAARNVAGSPRLTVQVSSPTAALTQTTDAGKLVLFVRVQDVDAAGTAHDIDFLTAPARVPDVTKPFTVTLPAFVHQFPAGHRIRLVVAGGSVNYRGNVTANLVTIATGSTGQVLSLPVVP